MSIIVYGVNKPSRCRNCPFCIATDPDSDDSPYECVINQYLHWATWTDVPDFISEGCKIGEIPTPHGRLIDADKLMKVIEENDYTLCSRLNTLDRGMFTIGIKQAIDESPTIIEAEQGDG